MSRYRSIAEIAEIAAITTRRQARPTKAQKKAYAAKARAKRYARAEAEGRVPGRTGRPAVSTHPRAKYWREWARNARKRHMTKIVTREQPGECGGMGPMVAPG